MSSYPVEYGRSLARAYGYPPRAVELVGAWLAKQRGCLPFRVTPTRIEVEIVEGVTLAYRHPCQFDIVCADFEPVRPVAPIAAAHGCAEYLPGGRCRLRPRDVCVEYVRALKRSQYRNTSARSDVSDSVPGWLPSS